MMGKERVQTIRENVTASIKKNFVSATTSFLFIVLFVNVFQMIFGPENSIVGVIFVIMMSASMVRDMTATPIKHLLIQAAVLVWMGVSACLVVWLDPLLALPLNLATIFIILYAYTYEYASHMYFPYILSYLFLIFISPVPPEQLPKRLVGLLVGAASIILYQLYHGRKRVAVTAQDVLTGMIDEARAAIAYRLTGAGKPTDLDAVRHDLCKLSRTVYERRKKVLCVSDASFSMIDAGRGLEHIILLLHELDGPLDASWEALLRRTDGQLAAYRAFVQRACTEPAALDRAGFVLDEGNAAEIDLYNALAYVGERLVHMTDPERRVKYRRTVLSLSVRLKAAMDVSVVRVTYALRTAVLLAVFTLIVQVLELPHGKWLLFTLASLSLPCADDVGAKTRKRLIATVAGGLVSVALYGLIPSVAGRTAVMMLSGYLSLYFSEYTGTYACSTVGALGGAVVMDVFGWGPVGEMFLIRAAYICVGAVLAVFFNCAVFPFKREAATRLLLKKYVATTGLLTRVCAAGEVDPQLYYNLVIQAHLQEDQLAKNAADGGWAELQVHLAKCRAEVRKAHRPRPTAFQPAGGA